MSSPFGSTTSSLLSRASRKRRKLRGLRILRARLPTKRKVLHGVVVSPDDLVSDGLIKPPDLIKVDVQGAELQVLAGATRTLREAEAVVLEVSLFGFLIGGPQLYEIVQWMKQSGFVVYDIFGGHYRPLDRALAQVDMVFVREDGLFRRSHAFATPEQREAQTREMHAQFAQKAKKL